MKFAVICDMHLPELPQCVQYDYFYDAVRELKDTSPDVVIVLGDITGTGNKNAFRIFFDSMKGISYIPVLGNSDVRDGMVDDAPFGGRLDCGRTLLCINTPYASVSDKDKADISRLADGDLLFLHHSIQTLDGQSREFITNKMHSTALTIIHAHSHSFADYALGKSRVISVRALDPDKSIGAPPCITYFELSDAGLSPVEKCFTNDSGKIRDFRDYLGFSSCSVKTDFYLAIKYGLRNIELKKYDDGSVGYIAEKSALWRQSGGKILSVHMPNVYIKNGEILDDGWQTALRLIMAANADAVTIHPPRVSVEYAENHIDELAQYYAAAIGAMPDNVSVGFENLHMHGSEADDGNRGFGYIPGEVIALAGAVNKKIGCNRAGIVLDVGHARNNTVFAGKYTLGMWYASVGHMTTAYHIHQVSRKDNILTNHTAISNWFGPMISYSSFFKAWSNGQINKAPVFLEMRNPDDVITSLRAFDNTPDF